MHGKVVTVAVEGDHDAAVVRRILAVAGLEVGFVYGRRGNVRRWAASFKCRWRRFPCNLRLSPIPSWPWSNSRSIPRCVPSGTAWCQRRALERR